MRRVTIIITSEDPAFDGQEALGGVLSRMEKDYGIGGPKYLVEWHDHGIIKESEGGL